MTEIHLLAAKLVLAGAAYVFYGLCLHVIAGKTGHRASQWWAWVPFFQVLLWFRVAGKPVWWGVAFPLGNLLLLAMVKLSPWITFLLLLCVAAAWVVILRVGAGLAKALHKPPWIGVLAAIPSAGSPFLVYLAFHEDASVRSPAARKTFLAAMAASVFLGYAAFAGGLKVMALDHLEKAAASSDIRKIRDLRAAETDDLTAFPLPGGESFVLNHVVVRLPVERIEGVGISSSSIKSSDRFVVRIKLDGGRKVTVLSASLPQKSGPSDWSDHLTAWVFGPDAEDDVDAKCAALQAQVSDITLLSSPVSDVRTWVKLLLKMIAVPRCDRARFFFNGATKGVSWDMFGKKALRLYDLSKKDSPWTCEVVVRPPSPAGIEGLLAGLDVRETPPEYLRERYDLSRKLAGKTGLSRADKMRSLLYAVEALSNDWDNDNVRKHLLGLYDRFGMKDDLGFLKAALDASPEKTKTES